MKKQRYPLTRSAEMQLAYAEATSPRFHEVLGHAIEWERLPSEDAQLIVGAAQDIARESGVPCASTVVVLQQLRLRVNAGRLTMEQLGSASDLLDAVEDVGGIGDLEGLISVVAPAVKKIGFADAVEQTIMDMGQGGSGAAEAITRFEKLEGLGKQRISMGSPATWTEADILEAAASTIRDPLPTGITELDLALGGGVERASLACFLGGPGDGKSLALCTVAAESIWGGWSVAYITAELAEAAIKQRVYANILGMTPQEMLDDAKEAVRRRSLLDAHLVGQGQRPLGSFRVLYVTPKVGTVAQIRSWLKDLKRDFDEDPEVLVLDYADKLAAKAGVEAKSSYAEQGTVYDQYRNLVIERDTEQHPSWGFTASQTTGRQGRKKQVGIEDIADSMEKARIVDTLIALQRTEEDTQQGTVQFLLPKRRNGVAHGKVGPLVMDPERGRMVTISRSTPW